MLGGEKKFAKLIPKSEENRLAFTVKIEDAFESCAEKECKLEEPKPGDCTENFADFTYFHGNPNDRDDVYDMN